MIPLYSLSRYPGSLAFQQKTFNPLSQAIFQTAAMKLEKRYHA
jgi:hypothetical protein